MHTGRVLGAAVIVGALLLVACSGDESTTSSTTAPSTEQSGKQDAATKCDGCPTYGESDTAITASTGDDFVVELESNPSTGYEWTAASSDTAVVRLVGDEYVDPGTDRVGAPGKERFVFDPVAAGAATLTFRYARSFEPDDPDAQELTYTVTVT